jgi:hypothetical protein
VSFWGSPGLNFTDTFIERDWVGTMLKFIATDLTLGQRRHLGGNRRTSYRSVCGQYSSVWVSDGKRRRTATKALRGQGI